MTSPKLQSDSRAQQRTEARLTLALAILSVAALLYYYAKQELLLYGDAVAHVNIARRVVDTRHPIQFYGQLGTVWLPLQHVAMLPFVWIDTLWRSGIAGAVPAMVAFVLGALGIFRLVSARFGAPAAYLSVAAYALNPNLLYMQTTAMNEPIFLAFFLWSLVYLDEFLRATTRIIRPSAEHESGDEITRADKHLFLSNKSRFQLATYGAAEVLQPSMKPRAALEYCGICMAGGALTRYDGWFSATVFGVVLTIAFLRWRTREGNPLLRRAVTKSLGEVLLLNALVPVYWLVYTWAVSGKALDFANGPYSAKAIALRSAGQGTPPYPGQQHIFTAGLYFLKSAQLNLGSPMFGGLLLILALLGTAVAIGHFRRLGVLLLLWIPLVFYALSIAYGSVPIYIPIWYPFSYYNVRYGLELLPVFAVFPVALAAFLAKHSAGKWVRAVVWAAIVALFITSYVSAYADVPITLREAWVNSRSRIALEEGLASQLAQLPRSSTLMMYEAEHAGALRMAGIPLRHVISEAEHPDWEWALLAPTGQADYIVACEGDPVWAAVRTHQAELTGVTTVSAPGQSSCTIYRRKRD